MSPFRKRSVDSVNVGSWIWYREDVKASGLEAADVRDRNLHVVENRCPRHCQLLRASVRHTSDTPTHAWGDKSISMALPLNGVSHKVVGPARFLEPSTKRPNFGTSAIEFKSPATAAATASA